MTDNHNMANRLIFDFSHAGSIPLSREEEMLIWKCANQFVDATRGMTGTDEAQAVQAMVQLRSLVNGGKHPLFDTKKWHFVRREFCEFVVKILPAEDYSAFNTWSGKPNSNIVEWIFQKEFQGPLSRTDDAIMRPLFYGDDLSHYHSSLREGDAFVTGILHTFFDWSDPAKALMTFAAGLTTVAFPPLLLAWGTFGIVGGTVNGIQAIRERSKQTPSGEKFYRALQANVQLGSALTTVATSALGMKTALESPQAPSLRPSVSKPIPDVPVLPALEGMPAPVRPSTQPLAALPRPSRIDTPQPSLPRGTGASSAFTRSPKGGRSSSVSSSISSRGSASSTIRSGSSALPRLGSTPSPRGAASSGGPRTTMVMTAPGKPPVTTVQGTESLGLLRISPAAEFTTPNPPTIIGGKAPPLPQVKMPPLRSAPSPLPTPAISPPISTPTIGPVEPFQLPSIFQGIRFSEPKTGIFAYDMPGRKGEEIREPTLHQDAPIGDPKARPEERLILSATTPHYADPRIAAFYAQIQSQQVSPDLLTKTLTEIFGQKALHHPIEEIVTMTMGHRALYKDDHAFSEAIANAMQKRIDKTPVDVTDSADVVLNYDRMGDYSSGGDYADAKTPQKTWDALLKLLRENPNAIHPIRPYMSRHSFQIPRVQMATLSNATLGQIAKHPFTNLVMRATQKEDDTDQFLFEEDVSEQLFAFYAEASELAIEVFTAMEWTTELNTRTHSLRSIKDKQGKDVENFNLEDLLLAFIQTSTSTHFRSNSKGREAFLDHFFTLTLAYLSSQQNPQSNHFIQHLNSIPADEPSPTTETYQKIYEAAQELLIQGAMDYTLASFTKKLRDYVVASIESMVASIRGTTLLDEELAAVTQQITATHRIPDNKSVLAELNRRKSALEVALALTRLESDLQKVSSWKEFYTTLQKWEEHKLTPQKAKTDMRHLFGPLNRWSSSILSNFETFSTYFGKELIIPNTFQNLELVPVAGLPAAVAIDSGSDCGAGKASLRSAMAEYSVVMVTDPNHRMPYGYNSFFEASAPEGKLVMIDTLNPSTRLSIGSDAYVQAMQAYAASMITRDPSIQAVLVSNTDTSVSNRTGIQGAVKALALQETSMSFSQIRDSVSDYEDALEQLQMKEIQTLLGPFSNDLSAFCSLTTMTSQNLAHEIETLADKYTGIFGAESAKALDDSLTNIKNILKDIIEEIYYIVTYIVTPVQKVQILSSANTITISDIDKMDDFYATSRTIEALNKIIEEIKEALSQLKNFGYNHASASDFDQTKNVMFFSTMQETLRASYDLSEQILELISNAKNRETLKQSSPKNSKIFYLNPNSRGVRGKVTEIPGTTATGGLFD